MCNKCNQSCADCTSANTCVKCFDSLSIINEGACVCPEAYYQDSDFKCVYCGHMCKICLNDEVCLNCYDENAQIDEGKCVCSKGFFESLSGKCEKCGFGCKICDSNHCQECIDENSEPDYIGCKCKKGFFNETTLLSNGICTPCQTDCEDCERFDKCISCKKGKGIVNSNGLCVLLCWKHNITSTTPCKPCPNLCSECNENLICTKCVPNSKLSNKNCICKRGYSQKSYECVNKNFYASLNVTKSNSIWLIFTEDLNTTFIPSSIEILIGNSSINFKMIKRSKKKIIIIPDIEIKRNQFKHFTLNIKPLNIYSSKNSKLVNKTFEGYLSFIDQDVEILGVDTSTFIKIIISILSAASIPSNPLGLWFILNTIQLIMFMPLNSVNYPEKLRKFSHSLMDYNIIPNVFEFLIDPHCTSEPYSKAYEFGIESSNIFINLGSMIIFFLVYFTMLVILIIINKKIVTSKRLTLFRQKNQIGFFINFWIQGFLEIVIYSIIQLKSVETIQEIKLFMQGYSSICLALILTVISKQVLSIVSPFVIFYWLSFSKEEYENREFNLKFGTLYNDLSIDKIKINIYYYAIFIFRRLEYSIVQIFLINYPWFQVISNIVISFTIILFLIWGKPLKETSAMIGTLIGEFCVFLVFIGSCLFLIFSDKHVVEKIEITCIYIVTSAVILELAIGLLELVKDLIKLYKKLEKSRALQFKKKCEESEYQIRG